MNRLVFGFVIVACHQDAAPPKPQAVLVPAVSAPPPAVAPDASPPVAEIDAGVDAAVVREPLQIALGDPGLEEWIRARVAAAKRGQREIVTLPIVRRSNGWGCVCPDYYVGTEPNSQQGPWLDPTFGKGIKKLGVGKAAIVEGTFGAETKHVSYPNGPPPTGRWEYDLVPFRITKLGAAPAEEDEVKLEVTREAE